MIPYGRQWIDEDDVAAVLEVLRSDWLTTGPKVDEFEKAFASTVGAREAVAVSSGTAALHAAVHALGVGPGQEVIVPAITFAASANAVVFEGGTPVFADVDPETLLLDAEAAERRISPRTRAIIAVDFAGQPCDYERLRRLAARNGLSLIADACHALGATYRGENVGTLARLSTFSFHPVKHITTGEGGMVTTDQPALAHNMRMFRNHGITSDFRNREASGSWSYEMEELGFNYRLSDLQCALGVSQLKKLPGWIRRRRQIAARYDEAFSSLPGVRPLATAPGVEHAYHLYILRFVDLAIARARDSIFKSLREAGIGVNVHYRPVHLHPFYRRRFGTREGDCPAAENAIGRLLTLPLYPRMSDDDVERVIGAVQTRVSGVAGGVEGGPR